jgi:hypothetical protein
MENTLKQYHRILFLDLRPYRHRDDKQDVYRELLATQSVEHYQFQPAREVAFFKPPTPRTTWYRNLIHHEAISYYNEISLLIAAAQDDTEKRFHVYTALNKEVGEKLRQVATETERLDYRLEYINPEGNHRLKEIHTAEETYIFQYLKTELIALYLNIQEAFKEYLNEEIKDEAWIYLVYFGEAVPKKPLLKSAEAIVLPLKPAKEKTTIGFRPVKNDIRPILLSKADYSIIKYPDRFAAVEEQLVEYDIIDDSYHFIKNKKQSNHTLLAAVYRELIDKNYFRRNIIGSAKKYTDNDIRKYLDERYGTDTSQQFRKLANEQREQAKRKLPWVEKIIRLT